MVSRDNFNNVELPVSSMFNILTDQCAGQTLVEECDSNCNLSGNHSVLDVTRILTFIHRNI